ncbi:hypothetical protein K490DRAFT_68777 [Saccharata proteae CBS 121410]|uniref:C2H2-type domain-containing protein n=1 Tax=Saccharata proteae CBS 121410 TaxID=1314787 RepID=A0A9P4HPU7_9PEZI|nr:hypothetical protein K490DRAFT_68777 [Saccharata proteae CBS 121410]
MSLFGGPLPSRPAVETDGSASPVPESLPPSDPDLLQPQDAARQSVSVSGSEASGTDSESEARPNKYHGSANNWRSWTANERRTVTSLDQIEAGDLSLHLYNAHALHRRMRSDKAAANAKSWQNKSRWNEARGEDAWAPPKKWTAWPMEPEIVPRVYEKFGRRENDFDDTHTFRGNGLPSSKPSQDMEETILGLTLKHAKIRWENREWDVKSSYTDEERPHKRGRTGVKVSSVRRTRSVSADSTTERAISHSKATAVQNAAEESPSHASGTHNNESSMHSSAKDIKRSESDAPKQPSRKRPRSSRTSAGSKPIIMADDDKAHEILQPIIRSTLTKLEDVLVALHRSRQYDVDYDLETAQSSGNESLKDRSTKPGQYPPGKRKFGRPPKAISRKDVIATQSNESKGSSGNESATGSTERPAGRRKWYEGRPKRFERLEGESYYMMHKRLAQEQASGESHPDSNQQARLLATPDEDTRAIPSRSPRPPKSRRRRRSSTGSSSNEPDVAAFERNKLRDWSSVLGNASLSGFDPAVIARTAKRCAGLFGEAMTFRMMHEDQALETPNASVEFRPDLAPSPGHLFSANGEADSLEDSNEELEGTRAQIIWDDETMVCPHTDCEQHGRVHSQRWLLIEHIKRRHYYDPEAEGAQIGKIHPRPAWDGISLFCPHEYCNGHEKEFTRRYRLVEHIQRKHGYDPNEQLDSEGDELVGGVHVDGFMQPIGRKQGWRIAVPKGPAKGKARNVRNGKSIETGS